MGAVVSAALGIILAVGCTSAEIPSDSETHFLAGCPAGCGELECICGICTRSCETTCDGLPEFAVCRGAVDGVVPACGEDAASGPRFCDVVCASDGDCARVSNEHRCVDGQCRGPGFEPPPPPVEPTSSIGPPEPPFSFDADAGADASNVMGATEILR